MPKSRVRSTEGAAKEEAERRSARLLATPAPAKVETKPKKRERINLPTKRGKPKGKGDQKGKQAKVANQEPQEELPAENGETKSGERAASDETEVEGAKSD